jgi:uncharacterized protein (TIGR03437 family)
MILAFAGMHATHGQQYDISAFAGGGAIQYPAPATLVPIGPPTGTALDNAGNLYFTSTNNGVYKVDSTGTITRVAGNGTQGFSGDGGPAIAAAFWDPYAVAVDAGGNIYVADSGNARVRMISPAGIVTTIAGNGHQGDSGDNGPALDAELSYPSGIAFDAGGNVYISSGYRVRMVSPAGIVTAFAGNGTPGYSGDNGPAASAEIDLPLRIALDSAGNLYVVDFYNNRIRKVSRAGIITTFAGNGTSGYSGDGGPATAAQLNAPGGVAADASGNLYIADSGNSRIRVVSPQGIITTIAGNGVAGYASDELSYPADIAVNAAGNVYIADTGNLRVRKLSAGIIQTIAGNGLSYSANGGPAVAALFVDPAGVAVDAGGNVYIADPGGNRIYQVSPAGTITTVAGNGSAGFSGDGGLATDAQMSGPWGVAVDGSGNLYISDRGNNRIRKVSASGIVTTVAGNGTAGYAGDGGPAIDAQLNRPMGVAVDAQGNVYFVDTYGSVAYCFCWPIGVLYHTGETTIRRISADGTIATVAGNTTLGYSGDGNPATRAEIEPAGVAVDSRGNVYIADQGNNRIRMVSPGGIITTVAGNGTAGYAGDGGPATAAELSKPTGVAVDSGGNLYIADQGNYRVRMVSSGGIVTTIAGAGTSDPAAGGPAILANLQPTAVAVAPAGQVYVADAATGDIRLLALANPPCVFAVSSTSFEAPVSGGTVSLSVSAGGSCAWTIQYLPDWVTFSEPASYLGPATIAFTVAANSGDFRSAAFTVANHAVSLFQQSNVFSIGSQGAVNAASLSAPVAPGGLATIFGSFPVPSPVIPGLPLPTSADGVSFQFNGGPAAPLFYLSLGQANVQVPWELAGQTQTGVTASVGTQTTALQPANVQTYAPGIFSNGILDANYYLVDAGNPASPGDWVTILCTGLGPVTNQPATGAPAPLNPLAWTTTVPTVSIGGVAAALNFYGLAPGKVGVYQVNAQVPPGTATGSAVPVTLSIGGMQ